MHALLHRIGLTPLAALTLVGYYVFFLTLQQFLPAGQTVIHASIISLATLPTYVYLIIIYAGLVERREGAVRLGDRRFWRGLGALLCIAALYCNFFNNFGYSKSLISVFQPYYLDPVLQKIDLALHGGTAPFAWFSGWLTPSLVNTLNLYYVGLWSFVMIVYVLWQMALPASASRTQFLSTFVMLWIIGGVVLATLFSSVGPVFYSVFYHDAYSVMNAALIDPLYDTRAIVSETPILNMREELLRFVTNDTLVDWNGISAMPSLHTAVAMLIALHSFRYARRLCFITIPFALVIIIGSVALGWHYLIDTYVSALLVALLWRINARLSHPSYK